MTADVIPLPVLAERLPLPPPPALDPLLDAAAECLARHGLSRTSLRDIARELGVAPSTVSRKVGSVEDVALLLAARELHRFLLRLPELVADRDGPDVVIGVVAAAIRTAADHPVTHKLLRDEGDWMGRLLTRRLPTLLDQGVEVAEPFLRSAMDDGLIRDQDPTLLGHWLARIALAALAAPPPGDLEDALAALLRPALAPGAAR